ncbi:MAG: hypothetical protein E4H33_03140 [Anaerolineales bacterium]|nr:MAG: hypothetical protein E4H33_03140 [Anaerolineales bacterium]
MDHEQYNVNQNEEDGRLVRILSIIIFATWVGYLFLFILGLFFYDYPLIILALVSSALLVVPMVQLRQKKLQVSSLLLVLILLASVTFIATIGQGIRDLALFGFPIIILFAGLVLGRIFFRISVGFMLMVVCWLAFGENFGWFVPKPFEGESTTGFYMIGMTIVLFLTALAVDLLAKNIRTNLDRAHVEIQQRERAEAKIRQLNASLEQRIEERTSELHEAQEQLVRKEKLATLGILAGSVGHELRNPLGVISSSIYYLDQVQPEANEKIRQHHAMIGQEVHNADKIISDLLDFSRNISAEQEWVSIPDIVQCTLDRYPMPASVEVKLKLQADLPKVFADPYQVEQILGNLTTNACQVMVPQGSSTSETDGGMMTISANQVSAVSAGGQQEEMVVIAVKDTGQGITPENLKKIFEPLFTTKTKGIGLGLAVSQKLAEANGGWIEAESQPGKGSTFRLYLPLRRNEG